MLSSHRIVTSAIAVISLSAVAFAQQGRGRGAAPPRLVLSVTSDAWADGGEVPMHHSGRGDNKSPAFEFHWTQGGNAASAPENLQTYAVIFHDLENSTNKTTTDTLHWTAFNIPGTAKGLSEGLGTGDLPDGTRNGPGIIARGGTQPAATSDQVPDLDRSITMCSNSTRSTQSWIFPRTRRAKNC